MSSEEYAPIIFFVCFIVVFMAIIFGVSLILHNSTTSPETDARFNKKLRAIGGTWLDRFFVECVLSRCDDFSQAKNIEKAKLIADNYNLAYPNGIEALFEQAYSAHQQISQQMQESEQNAQKSKEQDEQAELTKYARFEGRAKRIAMLSDRRDELYALAKEARNTGNMFMRNTQQPEEDWAFLGGFASALGGPAAGIATAMDAQAKNQQIRAQNEARREAMLPAYLFFSLNAKENRKNAEIIEEEIKETELKLVSDNVDKQQLFKKLLFKNTEVSVSETGTCTVTTIVSGPRSFKIFDDVIAVIDGTIIAQIQDDNRIIGEAELVLPVYGVGLEVPVRGMCLYCGTPGIKYRVSFKPGKLWAMER